MIPNPLAGSQDTAKKFVSPVLEKISELLAPPHKSFSIAARTPFLAADEPEMNKVFGVLAAWLWVGRGR
ncbi:MAG: hypothetical protein WDM77_01900 [Steroidobacteraceae bacterium]